MCKIQINVYEPQRDFHMNHLRIHLQLIGMAVLWGASWPWGRVVAQTMPTFTASASRFFIAVIPLLIWLYVATRFRYVKQLRRSQWIGLFFTAVLGIFAYSTSFIWAKICAGGAGSDNCHEQSGIHDDFCYFLIQGKMEYLGIVRNGHCDKRSINCYQ